MTLKIDGTFDIECADWDRFVLGVTYRPHDVRTWHSLTELVDYLIATGGTWWGHAAGVYDSIAIARNLTDRGIAYQASEHDHRITPLQFSGVTLRDSYSLFPFSLDELCGALKRPVPELPWACICGDACGGYCQIGPRAAAGDPDLETYCVADCEALYDGLHLLVATANSYGVELSGTLGGSAWRAAQRATGAPDAAMPWSQWRRLRAADKSGRLAIIQPTARGPGCHWDMINAYPSALAELPIPVGARRELGGRDAQRALTRDRPGIYTATVTVPEDSFLPPLPWRIGGRVVYPTGTFSGQWALPELVAAIERGARVDSVAYAIIWADEKPLFSACVRRWYAIRRDLGRHTPLGQWMSRFAKALTGKFAEDPERARLVGNPTKIKICLRTGSCRNGCTGRCRRYEQIDLMGHIWSAPFWQMSSSAHVQWSVYLRAWTRLKWLMQAEKFGRDLVYGNTDSIWSVGRQKPRPIGEELGHWELKNTWRDWQCRAPNVYRYIDDKTSQAVLRAAGTRTNVTETEWKRGHGVIDRGIESFRTGAGRDHGLFHRKQKRWSLPDLPSDGWYGDRKLDAASGVTYPADAQEYRDRKRRKACIHRVQ